LGLAFFEMLFLVHKRLLWHERLGRRREVGVNTHACIELELGRVDSTFDVCTCKCS
jgi:hypothetical protein